jgi:hypothetical protein
MRNLRSSLTLLAAALYVLLGISASWHAPHFTRGEAAVGVDAHSGEHEVALDGDSCALCSTKKSSQESVSSAKAIAWTVRDVFVFRVPDASTVAGFSGTARARAPPVLS